MNATASIDQDSTEVWRPSAAINPERLNYLWTLAERMASSSIVPESLRTEGSGDNKKDLPHETVVANVFAVFEQADRWNQSPFALLTAAAIVRGKLGFEGKVISAVLKSNFGVDLDYEWSGDGDRMSITVRGKKPSTNKVLEVTGTVAEWKTAGNGSPWRPATYKKMLAYRGAREWARLHEPSAVLGVLGDDEIMQIDYERRAQIARPAAPSLAGRFGTGGSEGFDPSNVARQIDHQPAVPMECIDSETGEIIEAKSGAQSGSAAKTMPSGRKADPDTKSSAAPASAKPSSSDGGGPGNAETGTRAQPETSPAASSLPAGDASPGESGVPSPRLSRDVYRKYAATIGRFRSEESVRKGSKQFFETEGVKPGTEKERDLFATIRDQYIAGVLSGGMDPGAFLTEVEKWVADDVPEGDL